VLNSKKFSDLLSSGRRYFNKPFDNNKLQTYCFRVKERVSQLAKGRSVRAAESERLVSKQNES